MRYMLCMGNVGQYRPVCSSARGLCLKNVTVTLGTTFHTEKRTLGSVVRSTKAPLNILLGFQQFFSLSLSIATYHLPPLALLRLISYCLLLVLEAYLKAGNVLYR